MASQALQNALGIEFVSAIRHREDGILEHPGIVGLQTLFNRVFDQEIPAETIVVCAQQCGYTTEQDFNFSQMHALLERLRVMVWTEVPLGNSMVPIFSAPTSESSYVQLQHQAFFLCRLILVNGVYYFQMPFFDKWDRDSRNEGTKSLNMINMPAGILSPYAVRFKAVLVPGETDTWRLWASPFDVQASDRMLLACHGRHCYGEVASNAFKVHTHRDVNTDSEWKLTKRQHASYPGLDVYKVEATKFPDHVLTVGAHLDIPDLRRPSDVHEGSLTLWPKSEVQTQAANTEQAKEGYQWVLLPEELALQAQDGDQ